MKLVQNTDAFLESFVELYKQNKAVRDSALVALLHAFCAKLGGNSNPEFPIKAINFFISLEATSRKSFDFVSANLLGPSLRTVQKQNAKTRKEVFILCDKGVVKERFFDFIECTVKEGGDCTVSIGFDGSKTPKKLMLSTANKAIIGGVVPDHFIDVSTMTEDEVKKKLDPKSDIIRADEIKLAVITVQRPKRGACPFFVLAGQPQTINMVSQFNQQITTWVTEACKERSKKGKVTHLASTAADGVGCDNEWVVCQMRLFLKGKGCHVGLIDTNHNQKNFRYQFLGGSCVVWIGWYLFDVELFRIADVSMLYWRIKDFASDLLVLRLASYETVSKIYSLEGQDVGSVAAVCTTLYMMRLRLCSVNSTNFGFRDRINFMWTSLLWMTSLGSRSVLGTNQSNMLANRRNLITESLACIFLFIRSDIVNSRYCTTEPVEHTIGGWRQKKREFTC